MQQLMYFQTAIFDAQEDWRNERLYHHKQVINTHYNLRFYIVQSLGYYST